MDGSQYTVWPTWWSYFKVYDTPVCCVSLPCYKSWLVNCVIRSHRPHCLLSLKCPIMQYSKWTCCESQWNISVSWEYHGFRELWMFGSDDNKTLYASRQNGKTTLAYSHQTQIVCLEMWNVSTISSPGLYLWHVYHLIGTKPD